MIGERVGNYRVVERIGEGGMGTVYRAMDEMLDREVALKVMRPEVSRQPGLHERFRQEAVALARLNHPRIAAVYGLERYNNDLVMVLEFVRGETLEAIVQRSGRLDWRRAFELGAEALEGLEHAHRKGVVHRDMKPANLMLAPDGHVKVMDFGIARLMGRSRQTRMGAAVGTPMYMSPEQLRGEDVDGRSDLYSLACVLYELITGHLAFEADSDYELMMKQLNTPAPPVRATVADVPLVVDDVLQRALAKAPDARFGDAHAMGAALRQAISAAPALPARPAPATRLADMPVTPPAPEREVTVARTPHTADIPVPRDAVPATRLVSSDVGATRIATPATGTEPTPRALIADWRLWAGIAATALLAALVLRDRPAPPPEVAVTPGAPPAADTTRIAPPSVSPPVAEPPVVRESVRPPVPVADPDVVAPVAGGGRAPAPTPRGTPVRPPATSVGGGAKPADPTPPVTNSPAPVVSEPPPVKAAPAPTPEPEREAPSAVSAGEAAAAIETIASAMNRGEAARVGAVLRSDAAGEWIALIKESRLQMSLDGTPDVDATGPGRATARFRATLNVRSAFGANRRRPAQFVAELARGDGGWRVTSLRPVGNVNLK